MVVVSDDFADRVGLGAQPLNARPGWNAQGLNCSLQVQEQHTVDSGQLFDPICVLNQVVAANLVAGSAAGIGWRQEAFAANQEARLKWVGSVHAQGLRAGVAVSVRDVTVDAFGNLTGYRGYVGVIVNTAGSSTDAFLIRVNGGTTGTILAGPVSVGMGQGECLILRRIGSKITFTVNGVTVFDAVDATPLPASGTPGVSLYDNAATTPTNADNSFWQFFSAQDSYDSSQAVTCAASDEVVLAPNYTIVTGASTFENTGLRIVLPAAGTYILYARVRGIPGSAATYVQARLFDSTAVVAVPNSLAFVAYAPNITSQQDTATIVSRYTVTGATTINLQAAQSLATASLIIGAPDVNGETVLGYFLDVAAVSSELALAADYTMSGTDTWEDPTNLNLSLAAGTYAIYSKLRMAPGSAATFLSARLFNETAGVEIDNSRALGVYTPSAVSTQGTVELFSIVTLTVTSVIKTQVKQNVNSSSAVISGGYTVLGNVKVAGTLRSGEVALASAYTVVSFNAYEDPGLSIALPEAGVYLIYARLRGNPVSAATFIVGRLFDVAGAAIPDSAALLCIDPAGITGSQKTATLMSRYSITGPTTIKVQVKQNTNSSKLDTDLNGQTVLGYCEICGVGA